MAREQYAGPDGGPQPPFPIRVRGRIIKGFGRGSKELGIPTANIPISGLDIGGHKDIESGVYYGWAGLSQTTATTEEASDAPNPNAPPNRTEVDEKSEQRAAAAHSAGVAQYAVYPMVMSIGWNPYYKNEKRSVEVHIIHKFEKDFYNSLLNLSILGFIRYEQDYSSLEALVEDINIDIQVAQRSVERPAYREYTKDPYLETFDWPKEDQ